MNIDRITGVDLMDNLLKISNENRYNLFFLGATDETLLKSEWRGVTQVSPRPVLLTQIPERSLKLDIFAIFTSQKHTEY